MRKTSHALLAALSLAGPTAARAADLDYDFLRGPEYDPPVAVTTIDWSGVYLGGHGGWSRASEKSATSFSLIANTASIKHPDADLDSYGISTLSSQTRRKGDGSFGAFIGYNFQFDDIVVGVEADYTKFDLNVASVDAAKREPTPFSNGLYTIGVSGTKIQDFGTIRGRAGYAFGNFLPFVTGGIAIGRARVFDNLISQAYSYAQPSGLTQFGAATSYGSAKTKTIGGITFGGGIEYAITTNVLLRAEYQYVHFDDFEQHKSDIKTVRGGAAVKF